MSKGGGTQTVVQDSLPEYAQPYLESILATGAKEYIEPYVQYGGQRVAEESPQRLMASQGIEALVDVGEPYFGEAMDIQRGVIRQYQEPQQFTSEVAQKYMTPFLEENLSRQKEAAISDYQTQKAARDTAAIQAGAFGGSRQGIMESQAESGLLGTLADIEASGRQAAFENAQRQFESDRGYRAQSLGSQAELAGGLAGLGAQSTSAYLNRLQQLEAVGKAEEARRQLDLDQAYQEFLSQQAYPTDQLERFSALIRGIPLPSQRTTQTVTNPNVGGQLLGLGLTGLQLAELGAFS